MFEAGSIVLDSRWKDLLRGALVATLSVKAPRVLVNANGFANAHANHGKPKKPSLDNDEAPAWQEKVARLLRFKISVLLTDGAVSVVGIPGETAPEVAVDRLNLRIQDITNSTELAPTLMATLSAEARVLSSGTLRLLAQG